MKRQKFNSGMQGLHFFYQPHTAQPPHLPPTQYLHGSSSREYDMTRIYSAHACTDLLADLHVFAYPHHTRDKWAELMQKKKDSKKKTQEANSAMAAQSDSTTTKTTSEVMIQGGREHFVDGTGGRHRSLKALLQGPKPKHFDTVCTREWTKVNSDLQEDLRTVRFAGLSRNLQD